MKKHRVVQPRRGGIFNKKAPYWRGERAEHIVRERVAGYKKKRRKKK